jgi:hypothetical protein
MGRKKDNLVALMDGYVHISQLNDNAMEHEMNTDSETFAAYSAYLY